MQHVINHNSAVSAEKSNQDDKEDHNVDLFGMSISNSNMGQLLHWLKQRALSKEKTLVNFVNAHCINVASTNIAYRRVLNSSTRLLPDGSGIKLAMKFVGVELVENLNGTDLFPFVCQLASENNLSVFLLGAEPGIAQSVGENMMTCFPTLNIAGSHHGFFDETQASGVIDKINDSGADILLVAMGVPQQELWLSKHLPELNSTINMGVGGLFDFYSKRISRAPLWLRKIGCEWTWRLLQEPGRMWRRYIIGNPEFIVRAMLEAQHQRNPQFPISLPQNNYSALRRRLFWWISTKAIPVAKRATDIIVASTALLIISPLITVMMLGIKLESAGPIFFSQQRVGLRGKTFKFWKFRSMYIDAEQRKRELLQQNEMQGGVLFKMKNDPRTTLIGRLIRRFSVDEIPQLWNVLRGDMSLVGPRPALPLEVAQYTLNDRKRLLAQPGITCIWQVSGRSDIPFDQQVKMDMEYIHTASLFTDIKLLLKTIPAVISGRGAY